MPYCATHGTTCTVCPTCQHHAWSKEMRHTCAEVLARTVAWRKDRLAESAQNTLPDISGDPHQATLTDFDVAVSDGAP